MSGRGGEHVHGIVVIDKPVGPTSHDAVAKVRRTLQTKRVGHAGTLDPLASGVLIVLVGEATKLAPFITAHDKSYLAHVAFGTATTTLDAAGEITDRQDPPDWLRSELAGAEARRSAGHSVFAPGDEELARLAPRLHEALALELRRTEQAPPAYSAIKIAGRRSYDLARQGAETKLEPRPVNVRRIELAEGTDAMASLPRLALSLEVSKGYYVRSLARDLGLHLGIPAHLAGLRRTQSGPFGIASATKLEESAENLHKALISLADAARQSLPEGRLTQVGEERARHGKSLDPSHFDVLPPPLAELSSWLDASGHLVAVGAREGDVFVVRRGFSSSNDTDGLGGTDSRDTAQDSV